MSDNKILAADTRSGQTADPITGTSVGDKRGMDVTNIGSGSYVDLVTLLLMGNTPSPNWDSVVRVDISSAQVNYEFKLSNTTLFTVNVTNADTQFPTAAIFNTYNLTLENGDNILLESGDILLEESG